ncbi:BspA family leucine-rich repeat surface protein [Candidatus Enterococcus courvalinii]|uniref:BspA family leucine-rich repeat surface protein n=1 Tax=Candidatus Enterococcus courvalinii TaxID=2815329 RepID=A0ABS3I1T7_9ENTE|nr:BspA family leucine-rich repeat surface protein [Enterococcus sp. MSG2901]MBO0482038.1 BspA family leucine-rich repeat surface protein [Enterococcus sp. MSG2901]
MSKKKRFVNRGRPLKKGKNWLVISIATLTICGSILQSSPILVLAAVSEFKQNTFKSTEDLAQTAVTAETIAVLGSEETKETEEILTMPTESLTSEQVTSQSEDTSPATRTTVDSSTTNSSTNEAMEAISQKEVSQESETKMVAADSDVKYFGVKDGIHWYIDHADTLHLGTENLGGTDSWINYQKTIKKIVVESPITLPRYAAGYFANMEEVMSFENAELIDTSKVVEMSQMFQKNLKLISIDVSNWNLENVTTVHSMFSGCTELRKLDVSKWDTKNIKDFNSMFSNTWSLTELDVSNWDVSNATNMERMFFSYNGSKLDVSNWNVGNVVNMSDMFGRSSIKELDLSKWDVSRVTSMYSMFTQMAELEALNLSNWNVANVKNMERMFYTYGEPTKLRSLNLATWENASAEGMKLMFADLTQLTELDLSSLDMSNTLNKESMLENLPSLTKLTLGKKTNIAGTNLTEPANEQRWRAVGLGTLDDPAGNELFSSADLMVNYEGDTMADTYVLYSAKPIIVHYVDENGDAIKGVADQELKYSNQGNIVGEEYEVTQNIIPITGYHFMNQVDDTKSGLPMSGRLTNDMVIHGGDIYLQYHSIDFSTQIVYPDNTVKKVPTIFEKVMTVTENSKYGIDLEKTIFLMKTETSEEKTIGSLADFAKNFGMDFGGKTRVFSVDDLTKVQIIIDKVQSVLENPTAEKQKAFRGSVIYTGPYRLDYQLVENKSEITGVNQTVFVNEYSTDNKPLKDSYIDKVINALGEHSDISTEEIVVDDSRVIWDTVGDYQVILSYTDSLSDKVVTAEVTVHVKATRAEVIGHDSTLIASPNQKWEAKDNFDSAVGANGEVVDFKDIKVKGEVDPTTLGDYEVTYSYEDTFGNVVSSTVTIHVVKEKVSTPDSEEPTIPVNESSSPESKTNNKNKKNVFPKTGEILSYSMELIGMLSSTLGFIALVVHKKRNKKSK